MSGIFSAQLFNGTGLGQEPTTPAPAPVKSDLSHFVTPTADLSWGQVMQPTVQPASNVPLIIGGVVAIGALAVVMTMMNSARRVTPNRRRSRRR